MKHKALILVVLGCLPLTAWPVDLFESVAEDDWVAGVEAVRLNCGHTPPNIRPLLEEYDSRLIREYFLHFEPRDSTMDMKGGIGDLEWKLMGLAMYGKKTDLEEMDRLLSVLAELHTEQYGQLIQTVARPAVMARDGNPLEAEEAMKALTQVPQWFLYDSLVLSGSRAARDKAFQGAMDSSLGFSDRYEMVSSLRILDDPRRLNVLIAPDFVAQARLDLPTPDDETYMKQLAGHLGSAEFRELKTVEALRDLVKQGFVLPPREVKKKTVPGGIDWSKYWKQTSRAPSKAGPASAPKRIEQPKLEKSAAPTPTHKPPASNAGALLAAGAALVGLLAVLIWFWRKR